MKQIIGKGKKSPESRRKRKRRIKYLLAAAAAVLIYLTGLKIITRYVLNPRSSAEVSGTGSVDGGSPIDSSLAETEEWNHKSTKGNREMDGSQVDLEGEGTQTEESKTAAVNQALQTENTSKSLTAEEQQENGEEKTTAEKKAEILSHKYLYPDKILEMLDKNIETIDFVFDYPQKKNQVYGDKLDMPLGNGEIPLLLQWDERWGYGKYGNNIVGVSGCGPACMAMVIAGLTENPQVTPYTMAVYSDEHDFVTEDGNTLWGFIASGGEEFGVLGQALPLQEESVLDCLKQGNPIICSMRPGDFTTTGHFIVLTGWQNGKISLNDPNSIKNSEKLWTYEKLEPQIKNLWGMEVIEEDSMPDTPFVSK